MEPAEYDATIERLKGYQQGLSKGIKGERLRIVGMLKEWKRHHDLMGDPKSLHYSQCIEEILLRIDNE